MNFKSSLMTVSMHFLILVLLSSCLWADASLGGKILVPNMENSEKRILATPVGSNVVTDWPADSRLHLIFNDDGQRIGAEFIHIREQDFKPLDDIVFVFPQLTVHKKEKKVFFNDELIATWGYFGLRLSKGFRLAYKFDSKTNDEGFNHSQARRVSVFIERITKK